MKRTLFFIAFIAVQFCNACTKYDENIISRENRNTVPFSISASLPFTRTAIHEGTSESTISWSKNDSIGLFIDTIQTNVVMVCTDTTANSFKCDMVRKGVSEDEALYCAYYPHSATAGKDRSHISATLPSGQDWSNPMKYDYMVATPISAPYDETEMPDLHFNFNSHLFAIVKINVTASLSTYNGETIERIGLKSTSKVLTGDFTFDSSRPDISAVFSSDELTTHKIANSYYPSKSRPTLNVGGKYDAFLIVNATSFAANELSIVVETDQHIFTISCKKAVELERNKLCILSEVDICKSGVNVVDKSVKKKIVLWGDSITAPSTFSSKLQSLLGSSWVVVNGGVSSDPAYVVAARQGGLQSYTGAQFVLKKSASDTTQNDGLWVRYTRNGVAKEEQLLYVRSQEYKTSTALIDPVILTGYYTDDKGVEHPEVVECVVDYEKDGWWVYFPYSPGIRSIHRLSDGEHDLTVKAGTPVYTYASQAYGDVDVIAVYVGTNGNTRTTEYYDHLIDAQDRMLAFLKQSNPNAIMIVCGYQMNSSLPYWTETYVKMMSAHYGDYFIDQRTEGAAKAIRYMKELGLITSESDVSEEDMALINQHNWPTTFGPVNDVHPNANGYKVRALLVRDKMKELKLIE